MAKFAKSVPTYKRRRSTKRGFFGWLWRIILWLFLLSILLVVLYRFIPPPITATMIGDVVGGRGLKKDWMSLDEMEELWVAAKKAPADA